MQIGVWRSDCLFESVAESQAGYDIVAVWINFLAQAGYIGVDSAVAYYHIVGPHLAYNLLAGVNSVAVGEEKQQYLEFVLVSATGCPSR